MRCGPYGNLLFAEFVVNMEAGKAEAETEVMDVVVEGDQVKKDITDEETKDNENNLKKEVLKDVKVRSEDGKEMSKVVNPLLESVHAREVARALHTGARGPAYPGARPAPPPPPLAPAVPRQAGRAPPPPGLPRRQGLGPHPPRHGAPLPQRLPPGATRRFLPSHLIPRWTPRRRRPKRTRRWLRWW